MKYKLTCTDWNTAHVKFTLFDPTGANCGQICVCSKDLVNFLQNSWNGDIFWDGKMPEWIYGKEADWPGYFTHSNQPRNQVTYAGHGRVMDPTANLNIR